MGRLWGRKESRSDTEPRSGREVIHGVSTEDRRASPRIPAEGPVWIVCVEGSERSFRGSLKDVSVRGFRVEYMEDPVESGQIVRFRTLDKAGRARAIWTRTTYSAVETGFLILED